MQSYVLKLKWIKHQLFNWDLIVLTNLLFFCFVNILSAQTAGNTDLLNGIGFIETNTYTEEENAEILAALHENDMGDEAFAGQF